MIGLLLLTNYLWRPATHITITYIIDLPCSAGFRFNLLLRRCRVFPFSSSSYDVLIETLLGTLEQTDEDSMTPQTIHNSKWFRDILHSLSMARLSSPYAKKILSQFYLNHSYGSHNSDHRVKFVDHTGQGLVFVTTWTDWGIMFVN